MLRLVKIAAFYMFQKLTRL
jgi:hypothetical protein